MAKGELTLGYRYNNDTSVGRTIGDVFNTKGSIREGERFTKLTVFTNLVPGISYGSIIRESAFYLYPHGRFLTVVSLGYVVTGFFQAEHSIDNSRRAQKKNPQSAPATPSRKKLSYKEQRELEQLEQEIPQLEQE